MAGIQVPGSSSFLLLRSFCYFSDRYHLSQGEGGNMKRRGTESVNFVTFGTTEAGKKPVKRMVVFRLELSYQEESRWWQGPPSGVRLEAALFIGHHRLIRMWKNIPDSLTVQSGGMSGRYTDPSSDHVSQRFQLRSPESGF